MNYTHILFDIDGTLIDTEKAVLSSLQDTILELQQRKIELPDLMFALGIPGEITLKKLGVSDVQNGNKIWNKYLKAYYPMIRVFDEIEPLIQKLKSKGYHLGIITSKNRTEYKNDFLPFGLDAYFDTVICVEDSNRPKPSPDPMLKYMELTNAEKNTILYIGDSIYDWQCALNAGVDFGLAVWGCHAADQIDATYYFNTPKEINL